MPMGDLPAKILSQSGRAEFISWKNQKTFKKGRNPFLWLKTPYKISKPYNKPLWEKINNGIKKEED
jgi:hypothetical protein